MHPSHSSSSIAAFLSGRLLLQEEIPFPLPDSPNTERLPGISKKKQTFYCERCGNDQQDRFAVFPCARCKTMCPYCRHCLMMGRVSGCTQLVHWTGPEPPHEGNGTLQWSGQLSEGQSAASRAVVQAVRHNSEQLIWAVCGAGKTEVLFRGIESALLAGKRVCIATPRTDVVLELAPRLQKVFPGTTVTALYGGSPDRHRYSPLVVSTTHQLFRFYQAFDVTIVDEVDAFPYSYDTSLQFAVQKARKPESALIYLTATPNETWQKECRQGNRPFVKIPARFHRQPLPVPLLSWCGNWRKATQKGRLPANVKDWTMKRLQENKQALLFFPHIDSMQKALLLFQQLDPLITSVHAEDPQRKEKVALMRTRQLPLLLSTTILERGVTFPNIDVAVIGAEDDVFTESALVQIAGRAGRSADFPDGEVRFFHYGKTKAIVKAVSHIEQMNREGIERGWLDR
ncbi:DEAD/DEAH box helicase [Pseudobacillus wudalianchiensis]|uniref:DNA/RNA helicase n=1 Tax=Pseudobacillus wudalianchiensis TaxID=1743143 RepID=A0A1B9AZ05_9BACI|nr:DEAD/DEAH box helicase [Bacillus wudalianchiensis]OCA89011.1 DNA/RNA helicase [Bacillus wudalianchiensis]